MSSHFTSTKIIKPENINPYWSVSKQIKKDNDKDKVDLSVATYRDDNGDPWTVPVVRKVEKIIGSDDTHQHIYPPLQGFASFTEKAVDLLLGTDNPAIASGRAFGMQVLSATGGLRCGAEFLKRCLDCDTFYCSSPTWDLHEYIFKYVGFKNAKTYRYWNPKRMSIDIDGLLEDLKWAAEKSVIILQGCGHNPTGMDPTHDQWTRIADVMEERKLIPFFDMPYQGVASGDLDKDAWAVRYFVKRGFELLCAQSFSKNFSLYDERVGNLTVVVKDPTSAVHVRTQLRWVQVMNSASCPVHGARIVNTILSNEHLIEEWKDNVRTMASRITEMRALLRAELMNLNTPGNWDHIIKQTGMYSYSGLTPQQVEYLESKHHIYMWESGRISVSGLNHSNVGYVANAIFDAIRQFPVSDGVLDPVFTK